MKQKILEILKSFETGMDDGYGGSVFGIFDDSYEDVADKIEKLMCLNDKKTNHQSIECKVCGKLCSHNQKKLPYDKWLDYAEKLDKRGIEQKQCPECKLWLFPGEF